MPDSGPLTFEMLVERYRQQLEILNYSPRTIQGQQSFLKKLQGFLEESKCTDVQTVTTGLLSDFQRDLFYEPSARGTARSVSSQNHAIIAAKNFFRFLKNEGYLAHDPAEGLRCAREPQTLPRNILTPQEARKIIEAPDTGCLLGYRDRTILEVLYATGIRKAELMNVTVADVNLEEELLRVNGGKGAKDRVVPLTRVACSFLENYIKAIRPELLGETKTHALFISQRARPISRNALGDLATKYGKKAGIKKHLTCHLWRHSCATHLVKNKANLRHVQEMLGHRSLATTERYLHLTITDLKEAHRKFHPREITAKKEA
jgi:integrase/recombinase XerD